MELSITILPETESVFLLNGTFSEGNSVLLSSDEVVYITVLPLNAAFLPYTIKLIGGKVACNEDLAFSVKTGEGKFALKLGRRSFVYSEGHYKNSDDICCKFFYLVKGGHFNFASELLSSELKAGLSDRAMRQFFSGFSDIVCVENKYFLAAQDGTGKLCNFTLKNGLIDNIIID